MKRSSNSRATIRDVALDAGVSIKTVSRVINKEASLRDETRKRVEASILRLHYLPNMAARVLAGSHSFRLALLYDHTLDHVNYNYIINLQNGVLDCCRSEDYDLLIHPCNFASRTLGAEIEEMARNTRLSGLILIPPLSDRKRLLAQLDKAGLPFATIASVHAPVSVANVVCDDMAAAHAMTRHLIDLGHRRIAIIKGHPDHGASGTRFAGFQRAMQEAGLSLPDDYVQQGYFDFESGKTAATALLDLKQRPTAIFAANDEMAAGAVHAALRKGIAVPEGLSVTGFDDSMTALLSYPTLTTVGQPTRAMARLAAQMLVDARRHQGEARQPQQHTLEHALVIRDSTARPPRA
jgi:LacI family transcriptional regulator